MIVHGWQWDIQQTVDSFIVFWFTVGRFNVFGIHTATLRLSKGSTPAAHRSVGSVKLYVM